MFDVVSTLFERSRTRVHITIGENHYMVLNTRAGSWNPEWFTDVVPCDRKGKVTGYPVASPLWRKRLTPATYKGIIEELVTDYPWSN